MTRPCPSILELARSGTTPLEQIAGLRFVAHCGDPDCPAPRPIPVSEVLAAHHGAQVGDVATGFRCTAWSGRAVCRTEGGSRARKLGSAAYPRLDRPENSLSVPAWDERADLLGSIRYALAYGLNGKLLPKALGSREPDITAERVLAHLERSAWTVARGPPALAHTAGDYTIWRSKYHPAALQGWL